MEENSYNNIGLGLIGSIRVWIKTVMDRMENEDGEVDYTKANELAQEIIHKRQVNRATRDAKRAFPKVQRAGAGWDCEEDFIKFYLEENGLSAPKLPEKTGDIIKENPSNMQEHGFGEPEPFEEAKNPSNMQEHGFREPEPLEQARNPLIRGLRNMAKEGAPQKDIPNNIMGDNGFREGGNLGKNSKSSSRSR